MKTPLMLGLMALATLSTETNAASIVLGSQFTNGTSLYATTFSNGLTATFTYNRNFKKKTQASITGVGIAGGRTDGEIDIDETLTGTFSRGVTVSSIVLGLLFDGPEYRDVNEVVKLSVSYRDGTSDIFTLTATGANTAVWSGSFGSVTSIGNGAINGGTGAWELTNPFGNKLVTGIQFGALPGIAAASCPSCNNQSDYTFVSMAVNPVSTVPVPAAAWLFGSGLLGLAGLRRKQA